jgi:uncharacterized protein
MDVALILTHRCNFACGYCYAGEHHKTDMEPGVLERAVDLLFADGADTVQLSFFGGEPFLAFDAMVRATELAEARAAREGKHLLLQCTTNGSLIRDEHVRFVREHGMRVTVSIDGVREAHDANRPCAGGRASFDQAFGGLRRLLDAGAACDAMMVITPQTAQHTYLSVSFLWSEGVRTVRANVALGAPWPSEDRRELREQLVSIGWELLARRLRGEEGTFEPFEREIRARTSGGTAAAPPRSRVVVATSGNLYPCAPMVGEDRDGGREAALRLGHLDDGLDAIAARVSCDGARCEKGGGCECSAYLETGDRKTPGAMGRWYGAVCQQIGATIAEALASHRARQRAPKRGRRRLLVGIAAVLGAAAVAAPLAMGLMDDEEPEALRPCQLRRNFREETFVGGDVSEPPPPAPGEMSAPPPPPEPVEIVDGEL